ncbi:ethionine resistance-conferring protein 1 [Diutina catenulata]
MVLFKLINDLGNPQMGGLPGGLKRRRLFIPPSTHHPLFSYGVGEQRSFLSLIEQGSTIAASEDDHSDVASVSTSRSLPSTLSSMPDDDQESFHSWLVEEHERRYGGGREEEELLGGHHADYGARRRRGSVYSQLSSIYADKAEDLSIPTTVGNEIRTLARYASPLVVTFMLEHLFSIVALLVVGHLGKHELAAVSLATMTTTISFAVFEGMATALDTLCPQAYGAGNFELVSLRVQRSIVLGWLIFVPIALLWWNADFFLKFVIDNETVVHLTTQFLRVMIIGGPAYVFFENGKRFLQAQGIFEAGTGILFISAPLNAALSWYLVWNKSHGLGFIGAPIAGAINFWFNCILMVLYVRFIDGGECWFGIASWHELSHEWGVILQLAIPGVIMLESEYLAYEIMTLMASFFGTTELAAQSAVASIVSVTYMAPFATGIAASTRIANFIGAENAEGAKIATRVALGSALVVGGLDCFLLILFRYKIAWLFSKDEDVTAIIAHLLYPMVPLFEIFDSIASVSSGILRAQGAQKVGGIINFLAYYAFGLPLAVVICKVSSVELEGLWIGVGSGMVLIGVSQTLYIAWSDWDDIVIRAGLLNEFDDDDDDDDSF